MERFWQLEKWTKYLLNSKFENDFIDCSFYFNDKYIPLLQTSNEFYSPYFDDDKHLLEEITKKAKEHNVKRIQVDSQIKSYLNIQNFTCVLDTSKDITLTKGCKSIIKTGKKYLIYKECVDIENFKLDYFRIAGKQTRPDKTFEILSQWIYQGNGLLLEALTIENKTAGYIYILYYKNWAYYFMGCTENECKKYGVSHFLIWNAIEILKKIGIQYFEIGEQPQNNLYKCPTEKEKNIALFKRSFGGQIIVNPISEYFFCPEYMRKTYQDRINKYIENEYKI